jgi:glycosyltransferase involved in cell wall biosynthesis
MERYIIITPVRDEEKFIRSTLESVVSQTVKPVEWVIVDDGSKDATGGILEEYASRFGWIKVVKRGDRGCRKAGAGVIEAFYDGYAAINSTDWDFVVKLDGDLSFGPDYFEKCFVKFMDESGLGIGGGTICQAEEGRLRVDSTGDPPFHVRGATKIYRRACWERISPLVRAPGWDTIDEVRANMYGWTSRTFPDLKLIQHKPTGAADGEWRNWFKNGMANYVTGYHPLFMIAKCMKRAFQRPLFLASAALWSGFCAGYLKQIPQFQNQETIRYLRNQQLRRLRLQSSIYDRGLSKGDN